MKPGLTMSFIVLSSQLEIYRTAMIPLAYFATAEAGASAPSAGTVAMN